MLKKGIDFEWLYQISDNQNTKEWIQQIETWNKDYLEKGNLQDSIETFTISLQNTSLTLRISDALRELKDFTEIFKENLHLLVPEFSGKNVKTVVDLGANIGIYSLKIKKNNPDCKILAVEPNRLAYKQLVRNFTNNRLTNSTTLNKAADDCEGKMSIQYVQHASSLSGANVKSDMHQWISQDMLDQTQVDCTTLKTIIKENSLDHIDILKIDVQEYEVVILKHCRAILERIDKIVVQPHSDRAKAELIDLLSQEGFTLVHNENRPFGDLYFVK